MQPAIDVFNASFGSGPDKPYVVWSKAGVTSNGAGPFGISYPAAVPSGATIIALALSSTASGISSIADSASNSYPSDVLESASTRGIYRCTNITNSPTSLTFTMSATSLLYYNIICVVGLANASPVSVAGLVGNSATGAIVGPTGKSFTTALANDFVCGYLKFNSSRSILAGGAHLPANISFTRAAGVSTANNIGFWYVKQVAGATPTQAEFDATPSSPQCVIIAYKKA
jgi:hypothetical protein